MYIKAFISMYYAILPITNVFFFVFLNILEVMNIFNLLNNPFYEF